MKTLTISEYEVLKAASEMPELHIDLLENPEPSPSVNAANGLSDDGYLEKLGGIPRKEYSFRITPKGLKCLEENERERAKA